MRSEITEPRLEHGDDGRSRRLRSQHARPNPDDRPAPSTRGLDLVQRESALGPYEQADTGAAGQGSKDGQPAEAPPADAGMGGFSASPFAPQAAKPQPPQPQATPPPFNP